MRKTQDFKSNTSGSYSPKNPGAAADRKRGGFPFVSHLIKKD